MKQSLSDIAYEYILDLIFSFQLLSGSKLFEQDVVDKLEISRTPVREAIRRLVADGVLDFYPSRYAEVHSFSPEERLDMGMVRMNVDTLAVQLAILNGSNRDFRRMMNIASACKEASDAGDIPTRIKYDCEFHTELVRIGGNNELLDIQRKLSLRTRLMQTQQYSKKDAVLQEIDSHADIINALIERDVNKCIAAVAKHLNSFYITPDTDSDVTQVSAKTHISVPVYLD